MAESFMINFAFNGKSCFANVYAYDTAPREYHVHIVNSYIYAGAPEHIVLIEKNEKLCLRNSDGALDGVLPVIVGEIRKHEGV
jgi:hypothetical protein